MPSFRPNPEQNGSGKKCPTHTGFVSRPMTEGRHTERYVESVIFKGKTTPNGVP